MHSTAPQFAETIRTADSLAAAWSALRLELSDFGFEYAKYGVVVAPSPGPLNSAEAFFAGRFPDQWEDAYEDYGGLANDYIADHCQARMAPITFDHVYDLAQEGTLRDAQAANHLMALEAGLVRGVALPVYDANPLVIGGLSLVGASSFTRRDFDAHIDHCYERLRALLEVFHASLHRPLLAAPHRRLSGREGECLLWILRGLRTKQIAARIGTHPKTVEKQLARARAKMSAQTNAQAAVRALTMNLITP
jgi:DNA-binding CsgD family transcriptional regulator